MEGGSNYWGVFIKNQRRTDTYFVHPSEDPDDFTRETITVAQMRTAFPKAALMYPHRKDLDHTKPEMWDAETADTVLQVALFGRIVFG
mgnify:FL=1